MSSASKFKLTATGRQNCIGLFATLDVRLPPLIKSELITAAVEADNSADDKATRFGLLATRLHWLRLALRYSGSLSLFFYISVFMCGRVHVLTSEQNIEIPMGDEHMENFVFAVVPRRTEKAFLKDRKDIVQQLLSSLCAGSFSFSFLFAVYLVFFFFTFRSQSELCGTYNIAGVPASLRVYSEDEELALALLPSDVLNALKLYLAECIFFFPFW
jgi:hypothetical protein